MRRARCFLVFPAVVLTVFAFSYGCAENKLAGTPPENQPPHVWLSAGPPEGMTVSYRLRFFWGGWDPDGEISHYEYAITDNDDGVFDPADTTGADKWHRVFANDSTFQFCADVLADSTVLQGGYLQPVDFVRSHSFFIRAVDDRGLASDRPAYRSFTARTLSPVVDIVIPTAFAGASDVPPIMTFKWTATDWVSNRSEAQEPDSVRTILVAIRNFNSNWADATRYIRENPHAPEWSPWRYYQAPGDSGMMWTTPALDVGGYVFAVQVKDEAGAVCPVFDQYRNVRWVLVSQRKTGPLLRLTNRYTGTIITSDPNTPPLILDILSGVPMSFRVSADASNYGGFVSGYRYGWDVEDFNDPDQWEVTYTPFVTEEKGVPTAQTPSYTWPSDSHTFYVEVMDNSGYTSLAAITVNVVPMTMERDLLLIDDYNEMWNAGFDATSGASPSDSEHDDFWLEVLRDVRDFEPELDVIEVETDLQIATLARYGAIIWDTYGGYNVRNGVSLLPEIIRYAPSATLLPGGLIGKVRINILAFYMEAGGHVLICGEQPMTSVINTALPAVKASGVVYPMIFRYELAGDHRSPYEDSNVGVWGVGDNSFTYNECCLNVLDISVITNRKSVRRAMNVTCNVGDFRDHSPLTDGLRSAIPAADAAGFPVLELRPEVAAPGKLYAPDGQGLANDVYNPPYFEQVCRGYAETEPPRACFQPIYTHGCLNTNSQIYGAPIAFWTGTYADRVPQAGGAAARSAVWGFEPVFFKPTQVREALGAILFDEWKLPRKNRTAAQTGEASTDAAQSGLEATRP
jgi:hypothetical protein